MRQLRGVEPRYHAIAISRRDDMYFRGKETKKKKRWAQLRSAILMDRHNHASGPLDGSVLSVHQWRNHMRRVDRQSGRHWEDTMLDRR